MNIFLDGQIKVRFTHKIYGIKGKKYGVQISSYGIRQSMAVNIKKPNNLSKII